MPDQGSTPSNTDGIDQTTPEELNSQETPTVDPTAEESTEANVSAEPVAETSAVEDVVEETPVAEDSKVEVVETEAPAEEVETEAVVETPAEEPAPVAEAETASEESGAEEDTAEVEADTADATEAESDSAEADTEDAEEEGEDEEDAKDNLMAEILGDHENLDTLVEKSSPLELVLLMETIAERGNVSEFISKVGLIKRTFDQKTKESEADAGLLPRFSTHLARFNKKRAAYYGDREKEKEANSAKKYELLERLKTIVAEEQVAKIQEVRQIQTSWREIGWVLQKDIQPLNETYRQYLDVFYTLRSKYQDLMDLDRSYNQKQKESIIAQVEKLIPAEEGTTREVWNERSQKVRALQAEWKSIGHVPREAVDEINSSYRNVLDRFYELRSGYYEVQDAAKGENAEKKRALLEQLKVYTGFQSRKAKDWNAATKAVLDIQGSWKEIGPGPMDVNKLLWKEYRSLCDKFFEEKGKFFKSFDKERGENLKRKVSICEQAEALINNENWSETAKTFKALQGEWKTIGPVHERHSNKVWKRFRKACDTFFDRRSEAMSADRQGYDENLKAKEAMIKELVALAEGDNPAGKLDRFNELQSKWKATGHVPFKLKDKINNAFKEAIGKFFEKTNLGRGEVQRLKMEANINSIGNEDARSRRIKGEMRKVRTRLSSLKEKVDQYELNIQFIAKGKKGDPLRNQIQGQIDGEKRRVEDLKKKLKDLKHLLDNPPVADEEE